MNEASSMTHHTNPSSATVWRKAASYTLEQRPEHGGAASRAWLYQASNFVARSAAVWLSSSAEVQAMLDHPVGG